MSKISEYVPPVMKTDDDVVEALSLRASGLVKRWHTLSTLREQTVAEHSAQALSLLFLLHPSPSIPLVKAVLWHDSAERWCGDVPAPVRRENRALADAYLLAEIEHTRKNHPSALFDLTLDEQRWLKAIDVLELWLHCRDEVFMGNRHFEIVANRAYDYLFSERADTPDVVKWFVARVASEGYRSFA